MKTAVHFGAGKIGKGFIADLLRGSGYDIIFVDVSEKAVAQINQDKQYSLFLIDHDYEERVIDHISALSSITEQDKVMEAITEAEIITTSVMAGNLSKIAPLLARGLKRRFEAGKGKAIVMACENAMNGTDILKKAMIDSGVITGQELDSIGFFPNTAVDRMVFDGTHNGKQGIEIGDAFELAIEKGKLPSPDFEPIKGAEYVDDLEMFLQRKIYIINCGHAISGYFGQAKGYTIAQDALRDPEIQQRVVNAVMESAAALEKKYGFKHESLVKYMNSMFLKRLTTPGVSDPITRVSRDPIRKIAPNERIMGPAFQCESYGLENRYLLQGVAYALKFKNPEDEQANELQNYIAEKGVTAAILKYTGIKAGSRMLQVVLEEYNAIQ